MTDEATRLERRLYNNAVGQLGMPAPHPMMLLLHLELQLSLDGLPGVVVGVDDTAIASDFGCDVGLVSQARSVLEDKGWLLSSSDCSLYYLPDMLAQQCNRPRSQQDLARWIVGLQAVPAGKVRSVIKRDMRELLAEQPELLLTFNSSLARTDGKGER